jgi:hypothetical protein
MKIVEGNIYTTITGSFIFEATEDCKHCDNISNFSKKFYFSSGDFTYHILDNEIRDATIEEKLWFLECAKAGRYVEKPEVELQITDILKKLNI